LLKKLLLLIKNEGEKMNIKNKIILAYYNFPVKPLWIVNILLNLEKRLFLLNHNRREIKTINNITYELDFDEYIDYSLYKGYFEVHTYLAMEKLVKKNMIVLDIGANMGAHCLNMAKLVGKKGKVIAFEPMKPVFEKLQKNLDLNKFENVKLEQIALAEKNEIKKIYFNHSYTSKKTKSKKTEQIKLMTLDTYFNKNKIEKVDFIKLDVDGYEYKILKGAKKTLKKFKPIIIMELGKYTLESVGDNIKDLIDYLFSLNYKFYREKDFKELKNYEEIIKEIPNLNTKTINVILK
jgi:FkbM family methyltransferase